MSERFKEPVLKTGDGATHRGFESHSLRQNSSTQLGWNFFIYSEKSVLSLSNAHTGKPLFYGKIEYRPFVLTKLSIYAILVKNCERL